METVLVIICLAGMLASVVIAVMVRSTFKAAIALAGASVALGLVMYVLGFPWASLFEISICSGFVTVIFISAATMTSKSHDEQDEIYAQTKHTRALPVLLIAGGAALIIFVLCGGLRIPYPETQITVTSDFGTELWENHKDLLLALLAALIAGTFAVVVLFKEGNKQ